MSERESNSAGKKRGDANHDEQSARTANSLDNMPTELHDAASRAAKLKVLRYPTEYTQTLNMESVHRTESLEATQFIDEDDEDAPTRQFDPEATGVWSPKPGLLGKPLANAAHADYPTIPQGSQKSSQGTRPSKSKPDAPDAIDRETVERMLARVQEKLGHIDLNDDDGEDAYEDEQENAQVENAIQLPSAGSLNEMLFGAGRDPNAETTDVNATSGEASQQSDSQEWLERPCAKVIRMRQGVMDNKSAFAKAFRDAKNSRIGSAIKLSLICLVFAGLAVGAAIYENGTLFGAAASTFCAAGTFCAAYFQRRVLDA